MKIISKKLLLYGSALLILSCGGGDDSGGGTPTPPPPAAIPDPSATSLIFPENNTECNEGVVVNDTQSTVTFRWENSQNTDSYEVNITNLNTNNTTRTNANINEASITIERGTPYEWFVVSQAQGTNITASSPTERFYNQGLGVENYAPFPAEAVNPTRGSTINTSTSVILQWSASDVDNDIIEFEILFGTETNPSASIGTTTDTSQEAPITSGQTYFWLVITKDSAGNTSQSEIFQFRVQ